MSQFAIREGDQSVTVFDYLCRDFLDLEQAIGDVCMQMESAEDMDAVMDSLQQAYEHFRHQFPGNIVPFVTDTWLLYPPYMESVFPKDGNVQKFAALFHILDQYTDETYENFPSVFGCPFHGADLSQMPQKTRLQRNLLDYLRRGNPMGAAHGIFFYGENGIIK